MIELARYEISFKRKVAKECLSGVLSERKLCKKYGIARTTLVRWTRLYKEHGMKGLEGAKGEYSEEFKREVVRYMEENNASLQDMVAHFNLGSIGVLRKWKKQYGSGKNSVEQNVKHQNEHLYYDTSIIKLDELKAKIEAGLKDNMNKEEILNLLRDYAIRQEIREKELEIAERKLEIVGKLEALIQSIRKKDKC